MRPGEIVELLVEKNVYRGLGLAHLDGRVVFIPRALAGDRVRVRIDAVERGFVRGSIESVAEGAADRRPPPCPVSGQCGGCAYQHARYEAQPSIKAAILRETFARAGIRWAGEVPLVCGPEKGWRVRATLHFSVVDGDLRLGLRREGSHEVVDASACLQISARLRRVADRFASFLRERPMLWRHLGALELRRSSDGQTVVAVLVGEFGRTETSELTGLTKLEAHVGGVGISSARRTAQVALLAGSPFVTHEVLGRTYRVHASSFFQANRFLVGELTQAVCDVVPAGVDVVELFAGAGLFTAALAGRAGRVRAVEIAKTAVEDCRVNIEGEGTTSIREADALVGLRQLRPSRTEHIVLDPPRSGAGRQLVEAIAQRKPAGIVYLSCDPTTLARDLAGLRRAGYAIRDVRLFDMFPDTFHLETLVRLEPA